MKKSSYPAKRTMNLFYKPDRTTRPATIALYVMFVLAILLGLSKVLVYDLWVETNEAVRGLESAQGQLEGVMGELAGYDQVLAQYRRFAATEEERASVDRMEVLGLLDSAVAGMGALDSVAITGNAVQIQFSGVTLAQTAQIVSALESSPLVVSTEVNTASTAESSGGGLQASVRIQLLGEVEA